MHVYLLCFPIPSAREAPHASVDSFGLFNAYPLFFSSVYLCLLRLGLAAWLCARVLVLVPLGCVLLPSVVWCQFFFGGTMGEGGRTSCVCAFAYSLTTAHPSANPPVVLTAVYSRCRRALCRLLQHPEVASKAPNFSYETPTATSFNHSGIQCILPST